MIRNFDNLNTNWSKTSIFKLEPETIDKEVKAMNSKSIKLNGKFIGMKLNQTKSKTQSQDGPFMMLDSLSTQIKEYMKNLPLIRVFSNPGMKERHWQEVSQLTGIMPINPEGNLAVKRVADIEGIFEKLPKL
jgi:dynein heavy chain